MLFAPCCREEGSVGVAMPVRLLEEPGLGTLTICGRPGSGDLEAALPN